MISELSVDPVTGSIYFVELTDTGIGAIVKVFTNGTYNTLPLLPPPKGCRR